MASFPPQPPSGPSRHALQSQLPTDEPIKELVTLIGKFSANVAGFYASLRQLESEASVKLPHSDPVALRCRLPASVTPSLLILLPDIKPLLLLFYVGFDYSQQGDKFFSELVLLAEVQDDWATCLCLLEARSHARHTFIGTTKKEIALARYKGISLNDITSVLRTLQTKSSPEPEAPRSAKDQQINSDAPIPLSSSSFYSLESASFPGDIASPLRNLQHSSPTKAECHQSSILKEPEVAEISETPRREVSRELDFDHSAIPFGPIVIESEADVASVCSSILAEAPYELDPPTTDNFNQYPPSSPSVASSEDLIIEPTVQVPVGWRCLVHETHKEHEAQETLKIAIPSAMFPDHDPKRQRIDYFAPTENDFELIQRPDTWIKDDWLNAALAMVCDLSSDAFLVDSWAARAIEKRDYRPFREFARRLCQSTKALVVVNVDLKHWVLVIIEHDGSAAKKIEILDSLPAEKNSLYAQKVTSAIVKHYLPATTNRARRLLPRLCNIQNNFTDCGVFVFAFGLFSVANEPFLAHLDCRFLRKVMVVILDGPVADWEIDMPRALDNPPTSDDTGEDLNSDPGRQEDCMIRDPFLRFRDKLASLEQQALPLTRQVDTDLRACDDFNKTMAPFLGVITSLVTQAINRASALQRNIDTSKRLADMREKKAVREAREAIEAACEEPTIVQMHLLCDRVEAVSRQLQKVETELRLRNEKVSEMFDVCEERSRILAKA
ncbi:hypothetical protein CSAL01_11076 [Colletotrichum salicis]|uniref:Ubiquitin-like protease family profile domain-containing protein n=1 Tax=Colletotrichum salicis TaxID=1209931 RepID=A0A135SGN8_9PEZI|nr:hypothetical protein CSAL01_11076 [Colletotrichum salicis]